jgi:flagellar biosynthesis protein FlhB
MAERTEAPTPRKREEAKRKGQVAKSVEVNSAVGLLVAFWLLSSTGPKIAATLKLLMGKFFESLPQADFTLETVRHGAIVVGGSLLPAMAPMFAFIMVAGVIANLGQVGFMFSETALKPDFNRISPLTGIKRIFSARGAMELLKSLLKLTVISFVVYSALRDNFETISAINRMGLMAATNHLAKIAVAIGLRGAVAMLVIAAVDYIFQRHEHEKNLRMTRQELIEEMKRYENQEMKNRIRARQRQMAMSRMMAAIPQADVIITNPTHIAVALKYEKGKMRAPLVVAKGQRLIADRIREKGQDHDIPMVENKPLARALFESVEVGQEIPIDLYQAVAEVLAFVFRIKAGTRMASSMAGW